MLQKEAPVFLNNSGFLWSFANLAEFPSFADTRGFLEKIEQRSCEELIKEPDSRSVRWLINKHWEFFLL